MPSILDAHELMLPMRPIHGGGSGLLVTSKTFKGNVARKCALRLCLTRNFRRGCHAQCVAVDICCDVFDSQYSEILANSLMHF